MGRRRRTPRLRVHSCVGETLVVLADVGVEGGQVCGVGERAIREAMVVQSASLIRIRMGTWIWRGCGSARGLVLGRGFWPML